MNYLLYQHNLITYYLVIKSSWATSFVISEQESNISEGIRPKVPGTETE